MEMEKGSGVFLRLVLHFPGPAARSKGGFQGQTLGNPRLPARAAIRPATPHTVAQGFQL